MGSITEYIFVILSQHKAYAGPFQKETAGKRTGLITKWPPWRLLLTQLEIVFVTISSFTKRTKVRSKWSSPVVRQAGHLIIAWQSTDGLSRTGMCQLQQLLNTCLLLATRWISRKATVIDTHQHAQTRCLLETWHIQHEQEPPLNRGKGTLPGLYATLLDWQCIRLTCL